MDQQLQQQQSGINPKELLYGLKRRSGLITGVFVAGTVLAALVAFALPPVYSSTARILIESQGIPEEMAQSTVTATAAERLQVFQQRLMTRQNLLDTARRLQLFRDRPDMSPNDMVEAMRQSTHIEAIDLNDNPRYRGPTQVSAFTLTYTANDPGQTAAVANEFVSHILRENSRQRQDRAKDTTEFFTAELERLQEQLAQTEADIAAFKAANKDRLPESLSFRQNKLLGLQERRFQREQRRIQLEDAKRALTDALSDGVALTTPQTPQEQELMELRQVLAQKRALLRDNHPQIKALAARIAALEGTIRPASVDGNEAASRAERDMKRELALIESQIALLDEQEVEDRKAEQALQESLAATPGVEVALAEKIRRYEDLTAQRDATAQRRAEAEVGERLEFSQQAERFEVIEQAEVPSEPDSPNRPLVAAGGAAGSLLLGIALALMLEVSNNAIHSPSELERRTGLRPVVTVPYIETNREIRGRRRRRVLWALVILVGIPSALYGIDQFVRPLPVLAERILDRTGLSEVLWVIEDRFGL